MLFRSSAVLAWGSLRFPWNWRACCSTLTPSLSITWLGRGVWIIIPLSVFVDVIILPVPVFFTYNLSFSTTTHLYELFILFPQLYDLGRQYSVLVCSYKFASTCLFLFDYNPTWIPFCCLVFSEQCGPHRPEEDGMLWHWRGGGRSTEGPNEQFPVLYNQPTGNCCAGDEGSNCQSITNACTSLTFRIIVIKGKIRHVELVVFTADSWDDWVHQPAEDRERLYAELQQ